MKKWDKKEELFLKKFYPDKGSAFCSEHLDRTPRQIISKAAKLGIRISKSRKSFIQSQKASRYRPDLCKVPSSAFIQCDSVWHAYILGFIWADGYLINKGSNRYKIVVEISSTDANNIKSIFMKTGNWTISSRKRKGKQQQTTFSTSNKELFCFLEENKYRQKSSISACSILAVIPKKYHSSWFHGFFDGDGGYYINKNHYSYQIHFTGSYDQDWTFLSKKLSSLDISFGTNRIISSKNHRHSRIRITNKTGFKKWIQYLDNSKLEGLFRKRDSAKKKLAILQI